MRLWGEDTTPYKLAQRLRVRVRWLYEVLDPVKLAVLERYHKGTSAGEISEELGVPIAYVKFVMRSVHAHGRKRTA